MPCVIGLALESHHLLPAKIDRRISSQVLQLVHCTSRCLTANRRTRIHRFRCHLFETLQFIILICLAQLAGDPLFILVERGQL